MRKGIATALFILAGCAASPQAERATFDFGPAAMAPVDAGVVAVTVSAPSWLDTPAMQYRLLYADAARRQAYAESRWAAPPAQLLAQQLRRRLAAGGSGACRLQIDLDEFVQAFSSPQASFLALEGRVTLLAGGAVLGRRPFALSAPGPSADARGGIAAARLAVGTLGDELAAWLAGFRERCRG